MAQNIKNKGFNPIAKKNKTYVVLAIVFIVLLLSVVSLVFIFTIRTISNISSPVSTVPINITHFNIDKAQNNPRLLDEFWNNFDYNLLFISPNPNTYIINEENLTPTPELTPTPNIETETAPLE
jgi:hypothetical protein